MVIMRLVTCVGLHEQSKRLILEELEGCITMVLKYFGQILSKTLPTYLYRALISFSPEVTHYKRLLNTYRQTSVGAFRTYDLVNCGPNSCFTIGVDKPTIVHNCTYGMGAAKLKSELDLAGFDVSIEAAEEMHKAYWDFFGGLTKLAAVLKREWTNNGGWLFGIRGEPVTIPKPYTYYDNTLGRKVKVDYTKDILNRMVQRAGSLITKRYIYHINRLRLERNVPMTPFIVDYHDATYWQCPDEQVQQAIDIFNEALIILNDELKWDVKISGKVKVGKTMADFIKD